ncbi:MAG TPA: XynC protein [Chitinophagaceae bacterium]|nr:XynC protein [Chitinophagaceae bacterium]
MKKTFRPGFIGLLLYIFCILSVINTRAGTADTTVIFSYSMNKPVKAVVIKPDSYKKKANRYPVVYLLHGYDGWYSNWIIREPRLKEYADAYQLIIVCPDGAKSSWYFDSPLDSTVRYETYVGTEVVHYIDRHYRTIADAKHRAITGLSMGGHGALYLALRHPETFGAAGSMSGGLDMKEVGYRFDVPLRIGDSLTHPQNWIDYSLTGMMDKYINTPVVILFDCGIGDIFIEGNRKLHKKMLQLNIPHRYTENPGIHSWEYWRASIPFHLLFFREFFNKN